MPIYAFGSNGSGQLGIGHSEDSHEPQLFFFPTEKMGLGQASLPLKFAAGGNATYVLLDDGTVYRAGCGALSSEGHRSWSSTRFERLRFPGSCKMKLCSLTWDAAICINEASEVYVEGMGLAGELSLGAEIKYSVNARKILGFPPSGTKIVDIASSVSHTVVVLSNGEAWGWGNGRKGQLGEPAGVIWQACKIIGIDFEVVRVECGREFTFLVGEPSSGRYAILGSDKWGVKTKAPDGIHNWKDIGATWGSLFVLDKAGLIKSWGRNDRGQLAPPGLPPIERMAAGSEHVLIESKEGKVLVWGWGEHGNCGANTDCEGNVSGRWNEFSIDSLPTLTKVAGIGAGCATSFIWGT